MHVFSQKTLEKIAETVGHIEAKSDCELVAVFARRSDDYFYIPLLWAALGALALPMAALPFLPGIDTTVYAALQATLFLLLCIILRLDAVLPRVIPTAIRRRRAERMAYTQFVSLGLNDAEAPPAVLFFVSLTERYVRIVTNAKVPIDDTVWQTVIDEMIAGIAAGRLEESILETITKIGEILQSHCPAHHTKENRFSNRLIVI